MPDLPKNRAIAFGVALALACSVAPAVTQTTASTTFLPLIRNKCIVSSPTWLHYGSLRALVAGIDSRAAFKVQCTSGQAHHIGLNRGATRGGTVATRLMTDGTNTIRYKMFLDPGRTIIWGDATTNDKGDTGTGSVVTHTIYGRVEPQATPPDATYADTVIITVTY